MSPGDTLGLFIAIGFPSVMVMFIVYQVSRLKQRKMDLQARAIAAQAAAGGVSHDLERRVRVLEQIVTDRGAETAAQIEALRDPPRTVERELQQ